MENWGCVTWTDSVLCRSAPDLRAAPAGRGGAAARDGAHVVRRPGDHALVGRPVAQRGVRVVRGDLGRRSSATEYTDGWASFLAGQQLLRPTRWTWARPATRSAATCPTSPTRWPTSTPSPTPRAQAVLHAADGLRRPRRRSSRGCAPTSRDHAWGNADPGDLMAPVGDAAGRDLDRLDRRVARPGRHRHPQPGRHHAAGVQPGRRRAAPARPADRLLHPHPARARADRRPAGGDQPAPRRTSSTCRSPTCTCSTTAT